MVCWEFELEQEHRPGCCVAAQLRSRRLLSTEHILMMVFTRIHQEQGGGKGHMPYAMGRTGWDFTCTGGITSVTLQNNFPISHADVLLMCAFNSSDLPLSILAFMKKERVLFFNFIFL